MVVVTAGLGGAHKVLLISSSQCSDMAAQPLRKRQRLTHLSPEEKALRRKLKNRVAAQTARDRKKAKMGELEQQVLELELENQKLHLENQMLQDRTGDLLNENEELRQRLGLDTLDSQEKVQVVESGASDMVLVNGSSERSTQATCASAAGAGPAIIKAEELALDPPATGTADSESDLLLGILDIIDPELFLEEAAEPNPSEQLVLVEPASRSLPAASPPAVGAAPVKLEALNELIQFDHIYTRPAEEDEEGAYGARDDRDPGAFSSEDEDVEVEMETVSIKDEPEDVAVPATDAGSMGADDFLSETSADFGGYDGAPCLFNDAYSDSGYERSPSPFSDMSSPLCSDASWEDVFASELFPQLISV
ncbi:LOW QUALITY PROTEIN: X-box-binding protein 1 [Trichomycterus rosablanca]|uniref:LOW QUALITY PROTEIN: X-box-binding protein 1 n=1 Tax=Trichomycterus rosablanca TaxID=2290929 RepID=UPI002F35D0F0